MHLRTLHELDQTEGTVQLRKRSADLPGESTLLLVPRPSVVDPNDPLRWPQWKKHICFSAVCWFTFMTNYAIGGLAPAFALLSKEFHKSMTETSDLLLWPILTLGLFNFFWVPMANYFGKRPIFVFASLLLCVACIWGAFAKSFESLLWSNIVAGFAGSSTEALGAAIVNDLYFLHERGSKMGIYMASISGGNTIGPLVCGFIIDPIGWRWHKGIAAITVGINFLLVLFFVPETRYAREGLKSADIGTSGTSANNSPSSSEEAVQEKALVINTRPVMGSRGSSSSNTPAQLPKKTYLQQLSLWSGIPASTSLLKMFVRPFPLILYPAVVYAFLGYAVNLAWTVSINILSSFVLEAPRYNFSPALIGLINLPGLLGNVFGSWAGGWLVDRYSDWRTRRNSGIFKPESRLPLLIVPSLIVPAGCLLFGYGVERGLHWVSLFFGYGMISVGLTAVPVPTMVYVSDCYFPVSPDALLLVNGLKNIVAFGFLYGIVPWVDKVGYVDCFGTQAGVYVAIVVVLGIPLYYLGEKIRRTTAQWRIIL